jgi:hypothetical protein
VLNEKLIGGACKMKNYIYFLVLNEKLMGSACKIVSME